MNKNMTVAGWLYEMGVEIQAWGATRNLHGYNHAVNRLGWILRGAK